MSIQILQHDCNFKLAEDRTLPYNTYIVTYFDNGQSHYDIVIANKKTDIFDYYWDKYREGLISFKQTEGRVNPKLWSNQQPSKKKK